MNKTAIRGALGGAILFVAVLAAAKAPPEIRTELKVEFAPVSQSRHLSVETPVFAYDGASWQREYAWSTNTGAAFDRSPSRLCASSGSSVTHSL